MGTHRHILRTLRLIALDYTHSAHPDLASMARELGQVVHRDAATLATRLVTLQRRHQGFERLVLTRRSKPPLTVLVVAWPANQAAPMDDGTAPWGLDMALIGALEVQSCQPAADSSELTVQARNWLGPGDGSWFEGGTAQLRRCRNLSRQETALSLHVYGADLASQATTMRAELAGPRISAPARQLVAGRPHG